MWGPIAVDLILATLNTPPQVDSLLQRLAGPLSLDAGTSGPSCRTGAAAEHGIENVSGRIPRLLHRRLAPEQKTTLVSAYVAGVRQKDLAAEYNISVRSVKRLVRTAREAIVQA